MKLQTAERRLGYEERGSGPPLILLHPFPFDRRSWAAVTPALADGRRVIALDARGFGESEPGGRYAIADLADDLAALMDGLGVAAAVVAGLSMGGYVALAFAHLHPARLRGLILADTRAAADSAEARQGRARALETLRTEGVGKYLDGSLPRLLAADAPAALLAEARALAETRAESLAAAIEALRDRPDRTAELPAIAVPTLVLSGARDQIVPPAEMRAMSQAIPGSRFVSLEQAGHLCQLESPAPFARAAGDFLRGLA